MTPEQQRAFDKALEKIEAVRGAPRGTKLELDLEGLGLTRLPPEIGKLANLTKLYLGNNQLRTLPPEIVQLANLKQLAFDNNLLSTLPLEIGQLANLT